MSSLSCLKLAELGVVWRRNKSSYTRSFVAMALQPVMAFYFSHFPHECPGPAFICLPRYFCCHSLSVFLQEGFVILFVLHSHLCPCSAVSGITPEDPVISRKSGLLYERRLIEKHLVVRIFCWFSFSRSRRRSWGRAISELRVAWRANESMKRLYLLSERRMLHCRCIVVAWHRLGPWLFCTVRVYDMITKPNLTFEGK